MSSLNFLQHLNAPRKCFPIIEYTQNKHFESHNQSTVAT